MMRDNQVELIETLIIYGTLLLLVVGGLSVLGGWLDRPIVSEDAFTHKCLDVKAPDPNPYDCKHLPKEYFIRTVMPGEQAAIR